MGKQKRAPGEEYNPRLKALILQVVDNQIAGLDETGQPVTTTITDEPDYVKHTFERLSAAHGVARAKEMIAAVLLEEMYDVLKDKVPFDEPRYKSKLGSAPQRQQNKQQKHKAKQSESGPQG